MTRDGYNRWSIVWDRFAIRYRAAAAFESDPEILGEIRGEDSDSAFNDSHPPRAATRELDKVYGAVRSVFR